MASSIDQLVRCVGFLAAVSAVATTPALEAHAQTSDRTFLGLTPTQAPATEFWEGRTDDRIFPRPRGEIRAIMLFARFPDAVVEESTEDLYKLLVPEAAAFFKRASYGQMTLAVDARHRWTPMDHPSTWEGYNPHEWATHRAYIAEVVRKAGEDIPYKRYDVVYVVGSKNRGMLKSPTWLGRPGDGIRAVDAEIRHAVTFGNDIRNPGWGWRVLAHETGHVFGLPDLYSYDEDRLRYKEIQDRARGRSAPDRRGSEKIRYKDIQRHVGSWDLMGFLGPGAEFLAWQKYKLGWLTDRHVLIARKPSQTRVIAPIDVKGGLKAIVVPIDAGDAYVVEVRSRDGRPESDTGVLCYKVSLGVSNGQGPIRVIPARPDDDDPELEKTYITLYHALFSGGIVVDDADRRIKIEIVGREGRSFRVAVTR